MGMSLKKLVEIGGTALSLEAPLMAETQLRQAGFLAEELLQLLAEKNGFYAFESALHVFPARSSGAERGLHEWNAPELWISKFAGLADNCLFFAEDVFGVQFCISNNAIHQFDPETGQLDFVADSLEDWADAILQDYEYLTGYPLAHAWQSTNGPLASGERLLPTQLFMLGGDFAPSNLYRLDAVQGMRLRAGYAVQLQELPDGAAVKITITE